MSPRLAAPPWTPLSISPASPPHQSKWGTSVLDPARASPRHLLSYSLPPALLSSRLPKPQACHETPGSNAPRSPPGTWPQACSCADPGRFPRSLPLACPSWAQALCPGAGDCGDTVACLPCGYKGQPPRERSHSSPRGSRPSARRTAPQAQAWTPARSEDRCAPHSWHHVYSLRVTLPGFSSLDLLALASPHLWRPAGAPITPLGGRGLEVSKI